MSEQAMPAQIWADPAETFDGMDMWRSEPGGKGVRYILANPEALAADPAVEALVAEAEARADTEAAVALALEEAAAEQDRRVEYWTRQLEAPGIKKSSVGATQGRIAGHYSAAEAIRALAPASGVAKLAALRAERDEAVSTLAYCEKQWSESDRVTHAKMLGERARAADLAAEVARLRTAAGAAGVLLGEIPRCSDAAFDAGAQWGLSHFQVGSIVGAFLHAIAIGEPQ